MVRVPDARNVTLEATEDHIDLRDVAKDTTVTFSMPHSDASAFHVMVRPLTISKLRLDHD
jgi:hypothetical protein